MLKEVRIDVTKLNTELRRSKALTVATEMYTVLTSEYFRRAILDMPDEYRLSETSKYKWIKTEKLYEILMLGKEEWNSVSDCVWNLIVDDYYAWYSKVVGYMNPGKPTIFVNTKFFDSMSSKKIGSNFAHEYCHTMGFRHGGSNFRKSIPYYMNIAYERAWDAVYGGGNAPSPSKKLVCTRKWYKLFRKKCYWVVS